MDQRDDRSQSKAELEPQPDIDTHHDGCGDNRPCALLAQLASDFRSHGLNPPNLKSLRPESLSQSIANLVTESPELDRGLLQSHEKLIGALLPEILNHGVTFTEGTQCLAHLGNGHFLIKPDLNDRAARKINT